MSRILVSVRAKKTNPARMLAVVNLVQSHNCAECGEPTIFSNDSIEKVRALGEEIVFMCDECALRQVTEEPTLVAFLPMAPEFRAAAKAAKNLESNH